MKPFGVTKWKMYHVHTHVITYITLLKNEDANGFLLYIGSVFGSLNVILFGL